jgi:hypothetical protein
MLHEGAHIVGEAMIIRIKQIGMMRVHAEVGVYASLRVMFAGDGPSRTVITYDRPSKMFGQWREPVFQQTGQVLDQKMETLIRRLAA